MVPFSNIFVIADIILMVLSIAGGGSLFCVIARSSTRLRSSYTVIVISLLLSDLLTGALVIPLHISLITEIKFRNPYLCKFYRYISASLSTAGVYSTLLLVLDTFYVVGYSIRNTFKQGICVFSLSFVWFFSLSYSVWSLVVYTGTPAKHVDPSSNTTLWICGLTEKFSTYAHVLVLTDLFVILALPVVLTAILYGMILSLIRSAPRKDGDMDLIKLTSALIVIHVITYLPVQISKFCDLSQCRIYIFPDVITKQLSEISPFFRGPLSFIALPIMHRETRDAILDICRSSDEYPTGRSRTDRASGTSIEIRLLDAGIC